jgi:ABC-2 type transport system ATP-binding protein
LPGKNMNTLSIRNLEKTYPNGVTSLRNVNLEIRNGMFGLLGPNGAGKSTLMRTIAGLQKPGSGIIEFNGQDIVRDPLAIKKHLGYLPQEFGVYPQISAYRLLDHIAVLKGITNKQERKSQIFSLLEKTNLVSHADKAVHTFSGGMKQRFGIAQALLGNPEIIIVDEPTAGLDPEERNRFNNLLSEIGEQVIIILSTHIVEDVRDLCTNMAIMLKGEIIVQGSPVALINALEGKIWTKTVTKAEQAEHKDWNIISSRLNGGKNNIHVYAEYSPGEGFKVTAPDLEDVYFSTLLKNSYASPFAI